MEQCSLHAQRYVYCALYLALHCTQDVSFSLFSYCHKFGYVLHGTNEINSKQQVAFLNRPYVPLRVVFVQA